MFNGEASYAYSQPGCIMQCMNELVISKCGCRLLEFRGKNLLRIKISLHTATFTPSNSGDPKFNFLGNKTTPEQMKHSNIQIPSLFP